MGKFKHLANYLKLSLLLATVLNITHSINFPISAFFNIDPPQEELAHLLCYEIDSVHLAKCCDCTSDCMKFKSCCIDYLWNHNRTQNLDIYIQLFLNESRKYRDLSCELAVPSNNKAVETEYVSMISECKTKGKQCHIENKTSFDNFHPVIGSDDYIYRNRLCAECNNVTFSYLEWEAKCRNKKTQRNIYGDVSSIEGFDLLFEKCFLSIRRNNEHVDNSVKSCSNNTCDARSENHNLCRSYKGSLNDYHNYHCYKCNTNKSQLKPPGISSSCALSCRNKKCIIPNQNEPHVYDWHFFLTKNNQKLAIRNVSRKFPIRQFFNISSKHSLEENEGFEQFLCSSGSSANCCSCNSDCMKTKSCCIDKRWDRESHTSLSSYLAMFIKESKGYKDISCEYVMPGVVKHGHTSAAYLMVSTCISTVSHEDKEKCAGTGEGSQESLPVIGSDKYIYKNKHCARCNNVTEFRLVTVQGGCKELVNSSSAEKPKTLQDFRKCHFGIQEVDWVKPHLTNCTVQLWPVRNASKTNPHYDLCNAYLGKMSSYANYHCLQANSASLTPPVLNDVVCKEEKPSEIIHYLTWSLILATNGFTSSSKGQTLTSECNNGEVYSIIQGKCITYTCGISFTRVGSKCVKDIFTIKYINIANPGFSRCLEALEPTLFLTYSNGINLMKIIGHDKHILGLEYEAVTKYYIGKDSTTAKFKLTNFSEENLPRMSSILKNSAIMNFVVINHVVLTSVPDPSISTTHILDFSRSYPQKRLCHQLLALTSNISFKNDCSVNHNGSLITRDDLSFWISISPNMTQHNLYTCKKFYLISDCKQEILPLEKTSINVEQRLVYKSLHHSYSFYVSQYRPVIGGFAICFSDLPAQWNEDAVIAEVYITIIGICISICCYIFIIATFLRFKVLIENIAGLCAVALCCCLLFSDTLFLIASILTFTNSHVSEFCTAVAILTHYALLVGNVWTVLIAYIIASKFFTFQVTQNNVGFSKRKEFLRYCTIAFSVPLFAVVLCIILEYTDTLDAGYGKDDFCMIRGLYARYVFYLIPAAVIFFTNILFLLYTTFKVRGENKQHEEAIGKSGRTNINIAPIVLRLIMIFGVTEIIGFIHIPFPYDTLNKSQLIFNSIFALLYSLLRSLRGFFLFVAYILRSQVIQLYKKKKEELPSGLGKDNYAMEQKT